ncbi:MULTISPECIES: hypothetical protein [Pseudomonas]|uniref:hypothetical protein n=1 Tax=Pseudomonas TaxID=286 RepID=UPI001BCAF5E8|nr:hypothetical protein [Pseudomonas sp. RC4D1]MBS7559571.1 hypothetical protein [Pseudomonas sp. RC4D1]
MEFADVVSVFSAKAEVVFDVVQKFLNFPLGEVLVFWLLAISITAAVVMKVRTRAGIILGFFVSIASAVSLMAHLSAASIDSKKIIESSEGQRAAVKTEVDKINSKLSAFSEPDKLLAKHRKDLAKHDELIGKNSRIQDVVTLLMNFVIMTLGGLGAGLLASFLTSDKTAEDEVAIENEHKMELIHVFEYGVSFVFITTLLSMVYVCFAIGEEVVPGVAQTVVDGAMAMILGVFGFVWASSNIEFKRHKVLLLTGFVLLVGYFYVQFMTFFLHYQPWALVVCLLLGLFPYGKFRAFLRVPF